MPAIWLTVFAAILRALSMPGWFGDWLWPLVFVSVVLRIMAWEKQPRLWVDYVGGLVYWLLCFSFLTPVHALAPLGAAVLLASSWWMEGVLYRLLRSRISTPFAAFLALPAAEYLRMKWFYFGIGGVPWASMGLALEPSPLYPYARVIGESGLVLLAVGVGVSIWAFWKQRNLRPSLLLAVLLIGASPWLSAPPEPTETLRCLTVQPNVSVEEKNGVWLTALEFYERQKKVTWEAFAGGEAADLVIWAETMWAYPAAEEDAQGLMRRPWPQRPDEISDMADVTLRQRALVQDLLSKAPNRPYFLTGAHFYYPITAEEVETKYSPRGTEFVLFEDRGHLLDHFSKQELMPFGESLPFGGAFPGSEFFRIWAHNNFGLRPDFHKTDDAGPLDGIDALPALGGTVCWENVFEAPFRRQADAGAQAFVILSNEDWFGPAGLEMHQMVAATRLRAAETGLAMLRSTNTGHTCLVKSDGEVVYGLEPNVAGWWGVDLPIASAEATASPYRLGGFWVGPIWAAIASLLALIQGIQIWRKRRFQGKRIKVLDPS
ncbi:MAG: hypothetical protein O3A95_00365 [Planctomycetota bacterium]|nr:hypothetical protein [Planctomycetota bacterium]